MLRLFLETDYQEAQTKTLLDKLYEGNAKGIVSTLIEKDLLSPDDIEDLKIIGRVVRIIDE